MSNVQKEINSKTIIVMIIEIGVIRFCLLCASTALTTFKYLSASQLSCKGGIIHFILEMMRLKSTAIPHK